MDQSSWQQIEPILNKALAIADQQQQEEFLKKACERNHKLYKQVSSLLTAIREAEAANFLEEN